ncbi:uncharacterized protein LOC124444020 isoform X3 [Xenia sp. Carnegie-2017]|uniref:uncharacterized protein LOC124444020 isoform X3 n=1 Tax=Xenia sp. Carnegie-2017 TaxID=2897299 RepID=UPI001F044EEB|nr:uncharacterized protein LOC124444020 isoform X3 [Xenia sp. Carnegie-2017]
MYGLGRGDYLNRLLDMRVGKDETKSKAVASLAALPKSPSPTSASGTWTPLDLLGNKGKRNRQGSDSSIDQLPSIRGTDDGSQTSNLDDKITPELGCSNETPKNMAKTRQEDDIHLITPEELLHSPKANVKEDTTMLSDKGPYEKKENMTAKYIPPHLRPGFSGKPDALQGPFVTQYQHKNTDFLMRVNRKGMNDDLCEEMPSSQSLASLKESERNWQKWKLQRDLKKLLNNVTSENVAGLHEDIRRVCEGSQLSKNFPGISALAVVVDLVIARAIEERDSFEISLLLCRILNVVYKDQFPLCLKEVFQHYNRELFKGVSSQNSSCKNFCIFLGKLCSIAGEETKGFQDCLRQSVMGCLQDWISSVQVSNECSQEATVKIYYLCYLLDVTKTCLSSEKRVWVKSCSSKIKNCIMNDKMARVVKENLLDQVMKCALQPTAVKGNDQKKKLAEFGSKNHIGDSNNDPYRRVRKMLSELGLSHLLEEFQKNIIRDSLLAANEDILGNTLKEAGFPPGAVVEIQLYLKVNNGGKFIGEETFGDVGSIADSGKLGAKIDRLVNDLKVFLQNMELSKKNEGEHLEGQEDHRKVCDKVDETRNIGAQEGKVDLKNLEKKAFEGTVKMEYSTSSESTGFSSEVYCPDEENCRLHFTQYDLAPPKPEMKPAGVKMTSTNNNLIFEEEEFSNCKQAFTPTEFPQVPRTLRNVMEFRDENTKTARSHRNLNERSPIKYKGRGRGRRDASGTLEDSGDPRGGTSRTLEPTRREGLHFVRSDYNTDTKDDTDAEKGADAFLSQTVEGARPEFGSNIPVGCFICGEKDHRTAYCKNNSAMFD